MTTLYVYNLSIKINQQNFLEYTNNQYEYNITVKEALEKVINDAFCRYTNLLNPDLKPCKQKLKLNLNKIFIWHDAKRRIKITKLS